jgi:hypothetical protein
MSDDTFTPPTLVRFAVVVDGEVAEVQGYSPDAEMQIAIYSSNPQIIRVTDENTKNLFGVLHGARWNGTEFLATPEA